MNNIITRLQQAVNQMAPHHRDREQGRLIIDCLTHIKELENEIAALKAKSAPFQIVDVKPIQFTCQNKESGLPLMMKLNQAVPH
jgi:hypothetical protein